MQVRVMIMLRWDNNITSINNRNEFQRFQSTLSLTQLPPINNAKPESTMRLPNDN